MKSPRGVRRNSDKSESTWTDDEIVLNHEQYSRSHGQCHSEQHRASVVSAPSSMRSGSISTAIGVSKNITKLFILSSEDKLK